MAAVTLEMLGQMVQRVLDKQREHDGKFADLVTRLSQVEMAISGLHRDGTMQAENTAILHARIDRMNDRLERIERRLDLTS
ncbi:MAG TPA: hypothetical protein HPQ04_15280 [Rhodospirillaceae bacterium]|nr:hypothetical protein [Rhodospirillaceae bacterium]